MEERRRVGTLGPPSGRPSLLAHTRFVHGNDAQTDRYRWNVCVEGWTTCQMLSEPHAGSDLGAARTRAQRDGDEWAVTGSSPRPPAPGQFHTRRQLMNYTNLRSRAGAAGRPLPGVEGPISKITVSDLTRGQRDVGLDVQGPHGVLVGEDAPSAPFQNFTLGTPAISIAGGTDHLQRNNVAERGAGATPRAAGRQGPAVPGPADDGFVSRAAAGGSHRRGGAQLLGGASETAPTRSPMRAWAWPGPHRPG